MSTALAEVITEPTLAELAETANREHAAVVAKGVAMLEHAIRAGETLTSAKMLVPRGEWDSWLAQNCDVSIGCACSYMRMAQYQDEIRERVPGMGVRSALAAIRGLPPAHAGRDVQSWTLAASIKPEAQRLRKLGYSYPAIGRALGCNHTTAYRALNPGSSQRYLRARAERAAVKAAEKRESREAAVRKIGGSVAESYSQIRKTLQALDRAHADQTDREIRAALGAATSKLHNAEDEIVRALGIS